MDTKQNWTTKEKITLFHRRFAGRTDVYGTYDPNTGKVWQVKKPVTDQVLRDHLSGKQPFGVYLLMNDKTKALVVDFDREDLLPPIEFVQRAFHYGLTAYLEYSKSKGYHAWLFFEKPVSAGKARRVAQHILEEMGMPQTEIFPKQDCLANRNQYGNFINAPLFGQSVRKGRTVFVDPLDPTKPYPDQWDLLQNIRQVPESALDAMIEINQIGQDHAQPVEGPVEKITEKEFRFGLTPCIRRILSEGVADYQRVTCFRLAVQLHRLGLPLDSAIAVLMAWATKNKPVGGKTVIRDDDIRDLTTHAYEKGYKGFGCHEPAMAARCDPNCPIFKKRNSL
jgi:hypothetical protein